MNRWIIPLVVLHFIGVAIFLAWVNSWPECRFNSYLDPLPAPHCYSFSGAAGIWEGVLVYMMAEHMFRGDTHVAQ